MSKAKPKAQKASTEDLLKDLMIINLAKAGLTQSQIREIVGGDIYKVNRIAKYFKNTRQKEV